MEYVLGEVTKSSKDKTQELSKYKMEKYEHKESLKCHIVPFVFDLKTSKAMYDKLLKLYSISTPGQKISLRNQLYRISKSKDEYMAIY